MPETKKYAIRCSTEEQARECEQYWLEILLIDICTSNEMWIKQKENMYVLVHNWYTIITYEEAVGLGLLGEKEGESKNIMKDLITWIVDWFEKEILEIPTREWLIKEYFRFDFDKQYENPWKRLSEFFENLKWLELVAEVRENKKNWWPCHIDRVYQYFINPAIKKFTEAKKEEVKEVSNKIEEIMEDVKKYEEINWFLSIWWIRNILENHLNK